MVVSYNDDGITSVTMSDHYRLDKEFLLAGMFVILLIAFAGWTGLRAVYSFVITILTIWKILVPAYRGRDQPGVVRDSYYRVSDFDHYFSGVWV